MYQQKKQTLTLTTMTDLQSIQEQLQGVQPEEMKSYGHTLHLPMETDYQFLIPTKEYSIIIGLNGLNSEPIIRIYDVLDELGEAVSLSISELAELTCLLTQLNYTV